MKSLQTDVQLHHDQLGLLGNSQAFGQIPDENIKGWGPRVYLQGDCVEHQDLETS